MAEAHQSSFQEAEALGFQKDFKDAHPLWNSEVYFILEQYLSKDNHTFQSSQNPVIQKTLEYVRKMNNYPTRQNLHLATKLSTSQN